MHDIALILPHKVQYINYCMYAKMYDIHYVVTMCILCFLCSYRLIIDPCVKDLWTYHHLVEFLYVDDYLVVVY